MAQAAAAETAEDRRVPLSMSHIGLYVHDLPKMEDFYTRVLGFTVTDRGKVRGLDIANITFIETEHGVVAFDALTCRQTAAAALALYRRHRGERPLLAVIYSHSHVDHFGGVAGLPLPARRDRAADEPRPEGRRDRRAPAAAPGALGPLARGRISNAASSAGWPR